MEIMFQSLLDRIAKLHELFSRSPEISSSSSSSTCSQFLEYLENLRGRMQSTRIFLPAAEEREITEESVRLFLAELRDVAYDSEDVLDEVEYELLRYQLECEDDQEHGPATHKERGRIKRKREVSDPPQITPPCPLLHDSSSQQQIIAKIRTINCRLDEICQGRLFLKMHSGEGRMLMDSRLWKPPPRRIPTSRLVDVRGREDDKRKMIGMLLYDDYDVHSEENVRVVSIVGTGGLGKSTLAQLVFKDDEVANHFDKRLWIHVSDAFDMTRLTKQVLKEIRRSYPSELEGLNSLQGSLLEELQGKRFLLVLDDVRNENPILWEALWVSLSTGAQGSRVLITTRSEMVSRISRVSERNMYRLGLLSDKDSWSLFKQLAFRGRNTRDRPTLERIGQLILKKCRGLPLTVKILAGLLFYEFTETRWDNIRRSDLWELPEGGDHILPALKLGYSRLPSLVKPCFTYCAVFPEDYKFDKDELVYLWMAQGYIGPRATHSMEDVGRECFEDLVQRSFFQQSGDGCFRMHSLIHDLALSIRGGECCSLEEGGRLSSTSKMPRHLWFEHRVADKAAALLSSSSSSSCGSTDCFPPYLRTFYLVSDPRALCSADCALSSKYFRKHGAFQSVRYLRALCLYGWKIEALPDSLGDLKHLRYLSIRRMVKLTRLPETLGNLLNLQTLQVLDAFDLEELPNSLKNLVNLRHLILGMPQYSYSLQAMPCGIGRLTQLQTLGRFVVGEGVCAAGIEELEALDNLRGELVINVRSLNNCITGGGGGGNGENVAILKGKVGLKSLVLQFSDDGGTFGDQSLLAFMPQTQKFIEIVQPNTNIEELVIDGYMGSSFPGWMADPSYSSLKSIRLDSCRNCMHLPALGQLPSLEHLDVRFMDELTSVDLQFLWHGMAFHEPQSYFFQALKQLHFYCLPECKELSLGTQSIAAFPHLDLLQIEDCQKLRCIRLWHLTSLSELHVARCGNLTELELQPQAVGHMHTPNLHTMRLEFCQKLNFPWACQSLPSSLRRFEITGSPLLGEWARRHSGD